ncbi:MAG: hypothetical protein H0X62_15945 [Bacteroidetes bacterium]|nr:hypothetical protein [Bacteroidota bacterium]
MNKIRERIALASNINTSNPNLKIAVTEININWVNPTPASNNTIDGVGANSFLASQWLLATYNLALDRRYGPSNNLIGASTIAMMPWSWHENSGSGAAGDLSVLRNGAINLLEPSHLLGHVDGKVFKGAILSN